MPPKDRLESRIKALFSALPGALGRQGEALFVKTPLYRAKRPHLPVYINRALFNRLFAPDRELSFEEMSAALVPFFSSTVEKENGTGEEIGTAYVDRQADPLNVSLAGNLGSGRAYYVGGVFNVKGERTPLATSERRQFSDGYLEMERCIWETLVANSLQGAVTTGLNGVLAILDMDELCEVEWRDKPVRRGKIIRLDFDGELDRITHLFARGEKISDRDWREAAETFGRLEGDKFIERLVHGTWSPGNISPRGHLIDFDTVSAVKGRSPQFSSSRWHHENYFGFEHEGQLNVLRAMAADTALNPAGPTGPTGPAGQAFGSLRDIMLEAQRLQIARRFPGLMGFADPAAAYAGFGAELLELTELWRELARKGYKKYDALSSKHPLAGALHVFDFSAFFRVYPLLRFRGAFEPRQAVAAMAEHKSWEDPYAVFDESGLSELAREYLAKVYAGLGAEFVTDAETFSFLQLAALRFVKRYDALFEKILAASKEPPEAVAARAYALNEDRFYLLPAYTASFVLAKNEAGWPPQRLDRMIDMLVTSCTRAESSVRRTDARLYWDGYFYIKHDNPGTHAFCFTFFDPPADPPEALEIDGIILNPLKDSPLTWCSAPLANARLEACFERENYSHHPCILRITQISSERVHLNSNRAQYAGLDEAPALKKGLALRGIFDEDAPLKESN